MNTSKIGHSDLAVSRINLGGNVFGWTLDEAQSFKILDAFADKGGNFIDTADVYSCWVPANTGGESETIIGKWLKTRRDKDKLVVATKVGWDFGDGVRKGLKPAYIKQAAEASLKRLQVDTIDLYYTHIDTGEVPVEEYLGAYAELIKEGKVRYIAASNVPADRLRYSLELGASGAYPLYQALQPHYNLVERTTYESEYAPIVAQYGLTVFPYWSLASGFLTGKYRSEADLGKSVRGGGVKKYLDAKGLSVLAALDEVAEKHHTSVAAAALAWLLAKPGIGAPIASATSPSQLDTLFAATALTLDAGDVQALDKASQ
ncbi:aldo/keto reductase [Paraflavitalea pollutisoli]|uniref:aldo/keto reductase n=1 Tax=Paraflavitalea pollutisoli TaxID=3034143 RepID=UPI0023EBFA9E|nr:aldo/keto reductase [Paraflavitalea sp. H1-2-19X]